MAYSDYLFDPTGQAVANKIVDEVQPIDMAVDVSCLPDHGPFFALDFKVEGAQGASGPWTELQEDVDFKFSPLFLEAGVRTTRKRVFSYIVVNEEKATYTHLRFNYQVLGKYQDKGLLDLVNASSFDRSKMYAWVAFSGNAMTYNPVTREAALAGKSALEILNQQLSMLVEATQNPHAQGKNLAQDFARLEQKMAKVFTTEQWLETTKKNDYSEAVVGSTVYEVKACEDALKYHKGVLVFLSSAGDVWSIEISAAKAVAGVNSHVSNQFHNNGPLGTVNVIRSGDTMIVRITPSTNGSLTYKTITDIWG